MKLTYIYHSGFIISGDKFSILIDYYKDYEDANRKKVVHDILLHSTQKLYILSTHSHPDHFNPEILKWKSQKDDITYIFSKEILDAGKAKSEEAIYLDKLEVYEDNNIKVKAFGSTDIGGSFFIEADGKSIFHAGDLNNWHWNEESTADEIKDAEAYFLKELSLVADNIKHLNLAIFPLDPRLGREYMKGAIGFVNTIKTDIFAPMHFGDDFAKIKPFRNWANEAECQLICWTHTGENYIF